MKKLFEVESYNLCEYIINADYLGTKYNYHMDVRLLTTPLDYLIKENIITRKLKNIYKR